jgi:isoleucyl-tRNA synthetase
MARYRENKGLNMPSIEQEILALWKKEETFKNSVTQRDGATPFVFYEGPPSANGMPGIHHVISRTLKDLVCRYKTMQGYRVQRKAGWDTHGLPVELGVEKELGITKEDIGVKISVEDYNRKCREVVMRYKDKWEEITSKMGYWVDMEHPYVTFDNEYIETLWWALKQLFEKDLLYKSVSIQPYSPAAGTGLSSHELNQPGTYKDVKDTTVVAMFRVKRDDRSKILFEASKSDDTYFLAWTTTPWTLPSNCGLTVGPNIDYVLVEAINPYTHKPCNVILAKELLHKQFSEKQIVEDFLKGENQVTKTLPDGKKIQLDGIVNIKGQEYPIEVKINPDIKSIESFIQIITATGYDSGVFFTTKPVTASICEKYPNLIFKSFDDFIIAEFKGISLEGIRYHQLLPFEGNTREIAGGDPWRVITGDFVTTEDGTGIVHTAPAFGADDYRVGKKNNIGILTMVDKEGKFGDYTGEFSGRYVKNYKNDPDYKDVDVDIAVKLKLSGHAFKVEKYEHSYPHCWRTDKPIIYYPLDAWFIRTTAMKDRMVELNKTINWKPKATGEGRFGNWLENMVDWNLSRSRFWGTPLPVWVSEDGTETKCIGSIDELKNEIVNANKVLNINQFVDDSNLDLHKPFVDQIVLASATGKAMYREPDLVDVWFDSGAMPYAQLHYPFDKNPLNELRNNFPADFIAEGVDQTRGWFYTLHALAVMLFDSVAYKTVVSNGLVLDKNGNKMSKRHGNVIDPFRTIEENSADATRWYLITNASPWDSLKFDLSGITEVQRKFFGTLYNTYQFFALYANVDGFTFGEQYVPVGERPEIDRWILSSLNSLIKTVNNHMNDYEPTLAGRAMEYFLDEQLSNWYVRLCRRRFWKGEYEHDKICAYQTLYECLETMTRLMAPIAPFFADWMYRNLNEVSQRFSAVSVHLADFPLADDSLIDEMLEERMKLAQDISSLVLSIRKKVNIKVRQPLTRILIPVQQAHTKEQIEKVEDLIRSEVNVKAVEYLTDTAGFIKKKIKPNFKALGARMGAKMKAAAAAISGMQQEEILSLEQTGSYSLNLDGELITITEQDVDIIAEDVPGWSVANKDTLTVALDITVTPELHEEGIARELVNRVQKERKDAGLELTDRIILAIQEHEAIKSAVINFSNYICAEILADRIEFSNTAEQGTTVDINDITINIYIHKTP